MGFLSGFKQRREQKLRQELLRISNPYVLIPDGPKMMWWRWEALEGLEGAGIFPRHNGLPVSMTKDECLALNGGSLPEYWGEVPYVWRTEDQKRALYAKYPRLFRRQPIAEQPSQSRTDHLDDEYPTTDQIEEMLTALETNDEDKIAEVLEKRARERKVKLAASQRQTVATSASVGKRDLTHEELMRLVEESSTRDLTDEELSVLAGRLCWRDEAAKLQWYREQGIDPNSKSETS